MSTLAVVADPTAELYLAVATTTTGAEESFTDGARTIVPVALAQDPLVHAVVMENGVSAANTAIG